MPKQSTAVKQSRVVMVCNACGSENVLVDAWAEWDVGIQRWVVAETFKSAVCRECDGECSVSEKRLS
jgi:hypothetical protein